MKIPPNLVLFKGTLEDMLSYSKFQTLPAGFTFFTDAVTEQEHNKKIDDYIAGYGISRDAFSQLCRATGVIMHFVWFDKDGRYLFDKMVFGVCKRNPEIKFTGVTDSPELAELMGITEQLPNLQLSQGMQV